MTVHLTPPSDAQAAVNVAERTSPGGLSYWLVEDATVPLVAMRFGFRGAGAVQDPAAVPGVANLAAALLDEGAGPHDAIAFQTLLEDNAIRLSFDASHDTFSGELTVVSDTVALGAELLALALTQPRFDADAIERAQGQMMAGLRRELNDPEAIASRLSARTLFPDHPYGRPVRGTLESVPQIEAQHLRDLHARALGRDRLHIAIVGDITSGDADALVDQAFGGLRETADLADVLPTEVPTGALTQQTEAVAQTAIRFALPGLERDDPEFLTAFVMNHILGGGTFSSRLFKQVREARGLTYSVYSYITARDYAPFLGGGASTRPERAQETLDVIRQVIDEFVSEGPTAEELQAAKDFLIGSYPLRFDSSQKIAQQLVGMQLEDMPISYMTERAGLIEAITVDDIRRVADRLLKAPLSLVIVGQPLS
ncbi:MAG: pitrilysin family protein [Pseudomonadota bacterium]